MDQPIPVQSPAAGFDDAGLAAILERIEAKQQEILVLQASSRRRGAVFIVLLFMAAVWFIWQILGPFRDIYSRPRTFLDALQHEETVTFGPILRMEIQKAGPRLYTAYDQAFQAEWEKRQPRLQGFMNELNLLLGQVTKHMGQQAEVRVQTFLDRYQRRMEADFPEIAKDDEALNHIHEALGSAITTIIGSRFHRPFETFCTIRDSFQALQVPDKYRKLSDPQLQETLIELITAYLNLHFRPLLDNLRMVRQHILGLQDQILDGVQALESGLPSMTSPAAK